MRILFGFLISTFALCSCAQKHEATNQAVNKLDKIPCKRSVLLKKVNNETASICLPEMETLKDCLLDSFLKQELNGIIPLEKLNVLAVYESDSIYNCLKKQKKGTIVLNDYYVMSYSADNYSIEKFNEIVGIMKSSFINKEWKGIRDKINSDVGESFQDYFKSLKFEKPLLVGNYRLMDNCNTDILLLKVNGLIQILFTNTILFQNSVIYLRFYSTYKNHNSIEFEQKNNDYFIQELISNNR